MYHIFNKHKVSGQKSRSWHFLPIKHLLNAQNQLFLSLHSIHSTGSPRGSPMISMIVHEVSLNWSLFIEKKTENVPSMKKEKGQIWIYPITIYN